MVLKKIGFVVGCFGLYHLAKKFVGVRPGMFVAPDNRIYRGMPEGGPVSGVVGFVDGDKALALCLTERSYPWSSSCISVPETRTMTSGLEATHKILETAWKEGKKAEAAEWRINYSEAYLMKKEFGCFPSSFFVAILFFIFMIIIVPVVRRAYGRGAELEQSRVQRWINSSSWQLYLHTLSKFISFYINLSDVGSLSKEFFYV